MKKQTRQKLIVAKFALSALVADGEIPDGFKQEINDTLTTITNYLKEQDLVAAKAFVAGLKEETDKLEKVVSEKLLPVVEQE